MPKWMTVAFALFLSLQVFSRQDKPADRVINNYVYAMGGKEKLESIRSVYLQGVVAGRNRADASCRMYKSPHVLGTGPLVGYEAKGHYAQFAGKQYINGKGYFKIRLVLKSKQVVHYLIDPETWYIVHERREGGTPPFKNVPLEIEYADYRKNHDGFIFPYAVRTNGIWINFNKIEVNKMVDPAL